MWAEQHDQRSTASTSRSKRSQQRLQALEDQEKLLKEREQLLREKQRIAAQRAEILSQNGGSDTESNSSDDVTARNKEETDSQIQAYESRAQDTYDSAYPSGPFAAQALGHATAPFAAQALGNATGPFAAQALGHATSHDVISTLARSLMYVDMPKLEIEKFYGNELSYQHFIRTFEQSIGVREISDEQKLQFLIQNCAGEAKDVIIDCGLYGTQGYAKARHLLYQRYGKPHKIARAYIDRLTSGPPIKASDAKALTELSLTMMKCELNMTELGFNSDINNHANIKKIAARLPFNLRSKWSERAYDLSERGTEPTFGDLARFVDSRAQLAASIYGEDLYEDARKPKEAVMKTRGATAAGTAIQERKCGSCGGDCKFLSYCEKFESHGLDKRREIVQSSRACFNCLKTGHGVKFCKNPKRCSKDGCGKKHHSLLHKDPESSQNAIEEQDTATLATAQVRMSTFLGIIPVDVLGKNGKRVTVFALMDNGSQKTFCDEALLRELSVPGDPLIFNLNTMNGPREYKGRVASLKVQGKGCSEVITLHGVWALPEVTINPGLCATASDVRHYEHLKGINLPEERPSKLRMIIGVDSNALAASEVRMPPRDGQPYAEKTRLGWVVRGPRHEAAGCHAMEEISDDLRAIWEADFQDQVTCDVSHASEEDKEAERIMERSCKLIDGHYQLDLPWRRNAKLPNNLFLAHSRLNQLSRKLERDSELKSMYDKQMSDNLKLGYVEPVPDSPSEGMVWYLPHHAVSNPNKPGKVRVVFDGAAKYQGASLNDKLLQGPDFMNSLSGILLRFRLGRVALSADIEGMFNQVKTTPKDRDALRLLWWPDGNLDQPPAHFRLTVQAFGLRSSPSIASYVVRRTARDNEDSYERATIDAARTSFYVDDFLKSVDTETEAIKMVSEMTELMKQGGFRLTKWLSTHQAVVDSIPTEERAPAVQDVDVCEAVSQRALGMRWMIDGDYFFFSQNLKEGPITKRGMLAAAASFFDPLGLLSPVLLKAKAILQETCRLGLGWDASLPEDLEEQWRHWQSSLSSIGEIQIPRFCLPHGVEEVQLHIFCDASTEAYGACAYLRTPAGGEYRATLILGKSRVRPLKQVTVPRLELQAAVIGVRVASQIRRELSMSFSKEVFWTDSQVVLACINNKRKRFKTYFANRLTEIHEKSDPAQWRHVPSKDNPADLASRGMTAVLGESMKMWLHGPAFLTNDQEHWPRTPGLPTSIDEAVLTQVSVELHSTLQQMLQRFSSFNRLKRSVGWLVRFKSYLMKRKDGAVSTEPLSAEELDAAEEDIIRLVQREKFSEELDDLLKGGLKKKSSLVKLRPILHNGIIRVGGRLQFSSLPEESKHPAILPRHHVTTIMIRELHKKNGHVGVEHVVSLTRERYWILQARAAVKAVTSKCVTCKRANGRTSTQAMAPLRQEHLQPDEPPFTSVGVDYFGPFYVKVKRSNEKRYGCIFVCLASKAVHLEVASSLSSDSLMAAIRRMEARRGRIRKMFSDNGTNMVGSNREMQQMIQEWNQAAIQSSLHQRGIDWRFNPPHASEQGGVWERQIRTVRKVLLGVLTEQRITDEMLATIFAEVERIINSRPLTRASDDPEDEAALTPAMILHPRNEKALPPGLFNPDDQYCRRWYRQLQFLSDLFWKRWTKEYLVTLQTSAKWNKVNLFQVDDIVLVKECAPRGAWPLARITAVHYGRDGLVRSCTLNFSGSSYERPITKLVPLEVTRTPGEIVPDGTTLAGATGGHSQATSRQQARIRSLCENPESWRARPRLPGGSRRRRRRAAAVTQRSMANEPVTTGFTKTPLLHPTEHCEPGYD